MNQDNGSIIVEHLAATVVNYVFSKRVDADGCVTAGSGRVVVVGPGRRSLCGLPIDCL
jgi:hypothetical protein